MKLSPQTSKSENAEATICPKPPKSPLLLHFAWAVDLHNQQPCTWPVAASLRKNSGPCLGSGATRTRCHYPTQPQARDARPRSMICTWRSSRARTTGDEWRADLRSWGFGRVASPGVQSCARRRRGGVYVYIYTRWLRRGAHVAAAAAATERTQISEGLNTCHSHIKFYLHEKNSPQTRSRAMISLIGAVSIFLVTALKLTALGLAFKWVEQF